jgi:beta-phosphoglucomutase-like phosphatase (HAD superfamily)
VVLRGSPFSDEEMVRHMHGRPNRYAFEYLLGRQIDLEELSCFTDGKEGIYRRLCLDSGERFKLSPGAEGLFDRLRAKGVPRSIATAMERTNIDFFFRHFELGNWFDRSRIVYDDGLLPGKPAPDVYLKAFAKLGLEPRECAVVEDSKSGMEAANAAKAGCLIALGPKAKHGELISGPGVSFAVQTLAEIDVDELFR